MTLEELVRRAMRLTARQRAQLAEQLLASLEDKGDADVEAAWLCETLRRRGAFRDGLISAVSAESAFADARAKLR